MTCMSICVYAQIHTSHVYMCACACRGVYKREGEQVIVSDVLIYSDSVKLTWILRARSSFSVTRVHA